MRSILLLFVILASSSFGQHSLRGTVLTKNEPVPYAKVLVRSIEKYALTDIDGIFELENLPAGTYTIEVRSIGFEISEMEISIPQQRDITIELISETKEFDEIVITGTMKEVSKKESTVNVEVFSQKFFKKNPSPSVYDALQNINGVRPQLNCNICNTGDIHINGLEGPYTMILIDGMPIVSSLSSVYGLSGIPNSLIERLEIVKGPSSTLYGSEAIGGIINLITKTAGNAPRISADVFTTSWLETNVDVGIRTQIGDRNKDLPPSTLSTARFRRAYVDILTGINYFNYDHKVDHNNDGFTDVTLQNRISLFQKWQFNRKDYKQFSIAGRYMYEDRWGGEMNWTPEFRGGDSLYAESIYTSRWEVMGIYQLPVKPKILFTTSFNQHKQNSFYGDLPFMADQLTGFGQLYWDRSTPKNELLLGASMRYLNYDDNTPATQTADSLNPQNMRSITWIPGIYLQDEIRFNNRHKLLMGIRYDYHSVHGSIVTPRIGYKWTTKSDHAFRLNAGTGYRVVNIFTEDHAALTGARDVVIVDEISPEQSYNVNLNYTKNIITEKNKQIGIDVTAFYTYFTNRIIADYDSNPNEIRYENLDGHAVSKGISANLTLQLLPGLTILTGATLMDIAYFENGQKFDQILTEKFTGTWSITYELDRYDLTFDYTGNVYSPMRLPLLNELDPREAYSPWWSIQNIQVTYNGLDRFEFYGGVKNLLNWTPGKNSPFLIARSNDPFDKEVTFDANGNAVATPDNPYGLTFDPSYVYGPNQGIRGFFGVRFLLK